MNTKDYLDFLRQRNIEKASKCHYCGKPTVGIESNGYNIVFVCQDHTKAEK